MTLIMLLLVPLAIAIALLLIYRSMYATSEARALDQQQRAEKAEYQLKQQRRLNAELEALQTAHRQETIDETTPEHLAARVDFDNDWRRGAELPDIAAADPDAGTAAAGPADPAGD